VAIAASALQRKGVPASELSDHVIAVNVDNVVNVITRPDAITNAQWREARTKLEAQGFKILLGPDVAYDTVTSTLISGKADTAFFAPRRTTIRSSLRNVSERFSPSRRRRFPTTTRRSA
jgi:hypothetical protein